MLQELRSRSKGEKKGSRSKDRKKGPASNQDQDPRGSEGRTYDRAPWPWLSDSLADRRYAVSLCACCAVLVECDQDASWACARGWALIQGLEALGLLHRQPPRDGRHGPAGHRSHTRIQPEAAQLTLLPKPLAWSSYWRDVTGRAAGPDPTSRRVALRDLATPARRSVCSPASQEQGNAAGLEGWQLNVQG